MNGVTYLTISFRKLSEAAPAITYSVEESVGNVSSWTAVDMTANLVSGPVDQGDGTGLVTIRGNVPIESGSDYLRLRVSSP